MPLDLSDTFAYAKTHRIGRVSPYEAVACLIHSCDTEVGPAFDRLLASGELTSPLVGGRTNVNMMVHDDAPLDNSVYTRILHHNADASLYHVNRKPVLVFDKIALRARNLEHVFPGRPNHGPRYDIDVDRDLEYNLGGGFNEAAFEGRLSLRKYLRKVVLDRRHNSEAVATRLADWLRKCGYTGVEVRRCWFHSAPLIKKGRPMAGGQDRLYFLNIPAGQGGIRASEIFDTIPLIPPGAFHAPLISEVTRGWRTTYRILFQNPDQKHCRAFAAYLRALVAKPKRAPPPRRAPPKRVRRSPSRRRLLNAVERDLPYSRGGLNMPGLRAFCRSNGLSDQGDRPELLRRIRRAAL
jgi:hypothetical protein